MVTFGNTTDKFLRKIDFQSKVIKFVLCYMNCYDETVLYIKKTNKEPP